MHRKSVKPSLNPPSAEQLRSDSNGYLGAGVGLGVFGLASGALLGAVCPLCIVATPALLGAGVYKRIRASRAAKQSCSGAPEEQPSTKLGQLGH